jgi:hypothetical protein
LKGTLIWGSTSDKTRFRDKENPDAAIAKFDFLLSDGSILKFYTMGSAILSKIKDAVERYGDKDGNLNPAIADVTIDVRESASGREYPDFI